MTWNGAGFDFRLLADETGRHADCARLAMASVDMMFQVLCERGHPLSLDAALKGAGLPPKMTEVTLRSGEPVAHQRRRSAAYWQAGEYAAVAAYCAADAERTAALAAACQQSRQLAWVSQKGRPNQVYLRHRLAHGGAVPRAPAAGHELDDQPDAPRGRARVDEARRTASRLRPVRGVSRPAWRLGGRCCTWPS